jgi:formylglycine-generating enzyme required for sulfatase activity
MLPRTLIFSLVGLSACGCSPDAEQSADLTVEPVECRTEMEGCEGCGAVGCPCFSDGSCADEASCSEGGTCVRIEHDMVYVPAGPFWMGCREGVDTDEITGPCREQELPYRRVTLDAFWIDRTEVRKGDYRQCMDAGVCTKPYMWDREHWEGLPQDGHRIPGTDDFPAASLSWTQAKTYCEWAGKQLPTEAQWEKAARGTDGRKYPWGNEDPSCAHSNHGTSYYECAHTKEYYRLTPVGMFPAGMSPYGTLDASGNVKEWTVDAFDWGTGYHALPDENPLGTSSGNSRAFRGGGYQSPVMAAGGYVTRTSIRGRGSESWSALTTEYGVRCAADTPVAEAGGRASLTGNSSGRR